MFNPPNLSRLGPLLFLVLFASLEPAAQTTNPSLAELQRAYAMRYLEPEPHMALARYYFDHGDRVEAFSILEAARRGRFEAKTFNTAFYRAFDGFDNSKAAEDRLLADYARKSDSIETIHGLADIYISRDDWSNAKRYLLVGIRKKPEDYRFTGGLVQVFASEGKQQDAAKLKNDFARKFPKTADGYAIRAEALIETRPLEARLILAEGLERFSADGVLLFDLGLVYQGEDYQKAEQAFVRAAEMSPKSELIQTWVGRFFFKVRTDSRRALEYYLNAYFLNPDAYETEFVESRIAKITAQLAAKRFAEQTRAGVPAVDMLADPNPGVASSALQQLSENWVPAYIDPVVQLMGHANAGVRWEATQVLKTNIDSSFDEQLKALLRDEDLRKRGLAAYLAVYRWKDGSFGAIKNLLAEESQLIRFDAVSALMIEGGPSGRRLALAHAAREPNATLKKLIIASKPDPGRP